MSLATRDRHEPAAPVAARVAIDVRVGQSAVVMAALQGRDVADIAAVRRGTSCMGLSGLWMTIAYPWPAGDGQAVYLLRLVFGTGMTASLLLGVDAIRRRRFAAHGDWMIRAYAIGMGAGTQVLTHPPWVMFFAGAPTETARVVMMGSGWIINVMVAELIIRRGRVHLPAIRPAVHAHRSM